MTRNGQKYWWLAAAFAYLAFFVYYGYQTWRHPMYNWDMLAYWGVVESYHTDDSQEIYDRTMAHAKALYSKRGYHNITVENLHSANANAFNQHRPFYTVKPLYPALIYLLNKLGLTMWQACIWMSVAGFIGIGMACFMLRPAGLDRGVWWGAVMAFSLIGSMSLVIAARYLTPDMLCTALCLCAFYFWYQRHSAIGYAACLLIAQLLRPDTIIFTVGMTALFALSPGNPRPMRKVQAAVIVGVCAITYILVNHLAGGSVWKVIFHFTFIHNTPYPLDDLQDFTFGQYLTVLWKNTILLLGEAQVMVLICASGLAGISYFNNPAGKRFAMHLLAAAWICLIIRFAVFPAWWEQRYYYANYFVIMLAVLEIMAPYLPAGKRIEPQPEA